MLSAPANRPRWPEIDTVLLDLDGTLLDLAFDNYVWMGRIPEIYAETRGLSVPEAQAALSPKFHALRGTLDWYCIEHWSRALDIDIERLHRDEAHRIAWLPGARGFLERMRELGKRLVLLTNSHPVTLAIKHERTGVLDYFDAAFSSRQFGAPKEDARFWREVRVAERFDPARSVFVDDSAAVLHAARAAGIRWVFAVRRPDTSRRGHAHEEFTAIDAVAELV